MFSLWAHLRSLVLPYGTLTGTRIVLDGILGRISVFNAGNNEVTRIDSATSKTTVGTIGAGRIELNGATPAKIEIFDSTGASTIALDTNPSVIALTSPVDGSEILLRASPAAVMSLYPSTMVGHTWNPAYVAADHDNVAHPRPWVSVIAPYDNTSPTLSSAELVLYGSRDDGTGNDAGISCNAFQISAESVTVQPVLGATSNITVTGDVAIVNGKLRGGIDSGDAACSAPLTLATFAQAITGASISVTTYNSNAVVLIEGIFDFQCNAFTSATTALGLCYRSDTGALLRQAILTITQNGQRATVAQTWRTVIATPGTINIYLAAYKTANVDTVVANTTHTAVKVMVLEQ